MSAILFRPDETFPQAKARTIAEDCAEYGLTRQEAADHLSDLVPEWLDGARAWIKGGATPSQAWINSTREAFPEWWDRRVCHDCPAAFDRMAHAGRSLYRTKADHLAAWKPL